MDSWFVAGGSRGAIEKRPKVPPQGGEIPNCQAKADVHGYVQLSDGAALLEYASAAGVAMRSYAAGVLEVPEGHS